MRKDLKREEKKKKEKKRKKERKLYIKLIPLSVERSR